MSGVLRRRTGSLRVATAMLVTAMLATAMLAGAPCSAAEPAPRVVIASKKFTESVVLGEILAAAAREAGARAEHRAELGGTRIVWNALRRGDVDAYVEYSGTLREEILADRDLPDERAIREAIAAEGLVMGPALGFNNTYAIGMREERAEELGIRTISDLARHPALALGFTNEFLDRSDGWPSLQGAYRLPHRDIRGLDHDLAYRALESGAIDAMDLYSTDAEIRYYRLRVLEDDLGHFPEYAALLLWRADLGTRAPSVVEAFRALGGSLDEAGMIALNARAKLDRIPAPEVAAAFLRDRTGTEIETIGTDGWGAGLLRRTGEHLALVGISLLAAILVAVPLGIVAARRARLGQVVLGVTGIIQTIPALALLVVMIPLFGIGTRPAIVALFLYSLLPIVRNTAAGLNGIAPELRESARALGLEPGARLRLVELPLALPSILAGIKTSAVINVGTATLGALIGAGGYGQPILTGIRLDDAGLILQGALPAAGLALVAQGLFEAAERWAVPRGLR